MYSTLTKLQKEKETCDNCKPGLHYLHTYSVLDFVHGKQFQTWQQLFCLVKKKHLHSIIFSLNLQLLYGCVRGNTGLPLHSCVTFSDLKSARNTFVLFTICVYEQKETCRFQMLTYCLLSASFWGQKFHVFCR